MNLEQFYQHIQHDTYRALKNAPLSNHLVPHIRKTFSSTHAKFWILLPFHIATFKNTRITSDRLQSICTLQAIGWTMYRIYDDIVDENDVKLVPLFSTLSRLFYKSYYSLNPSVSAERLLDQQDEDFLGQTDGTDVTLLGLELLPKCPKEIKWIFRNYTRIRKIHDDVFDSIEDGVAIQLEKIIPAIEMCIGDIEKATLSVSHDSKQYIEKILLPFKQHLDYITQLLLAHQHAVPHR